MPAASSKKSAPMTFYTPGIDRRRHTPRAPIAPLSHSLSRLEKPRVQSRISNQASPHCWCFSTVVVAAAADVFFISFFFISVLFAPEHTKRFCSNHPPCTMEKVWIVKRKLVRVKTTKRKNKKKKLIIDVKKIFEQKKKEKLTSAFAYASSL